MGAIVKKGVGLVSAIGLPAWMAYVVYGWITYTGAWQWMAEWEIQQFGSYREKATLLALVGGPVLVFSGLALIINRLSPGTLDGPNPLRTNPAVAALNAPVNTNKMLGGIVVVALVVGAVAGFVGYQKSQTETTFEAVDVARGDTPGSRHIMLSGIARTDAIVLLEKTFNGSKTEETYLPVTAPNWRKGDPVSFFLMPRGNAYVGPGGFQMFQLNTRPFGIQQTGTVFSDGLPGVVRTEFERRGIVMAPKVYVLDTKADADLGIYFGIAFASGLCVVVVLMTMLILRLKRPRPAPT